MDSSTENRYGWEYIQNTNVLRIDPHRSFDFGNAELKCSVDSLGTTQGGIFTEEYICEYGGTIESGIFNNKVRTINATSAGYGVGRIQNGTFNAEVDNAGLIENGVFMEHVINGEASGGGREDSGETGGGGESGGESGWDDGNGGGGGGRVEEWSAPVANRPVVFAAENRVTQATIDGGTFTGTVTNYALITGGVFKNAITNRNGTIAPEAKKLTVTNASVKINDVFEQDINTPTYVVGDKTVEVTYSGNMTGKHWKVTGGTVNDKNNATVYVTMPGDADVTLELVDEAKPDPVNPGGDDAEIGVKLDVDTNAAAFDENGNIITTAKPGQKLTLKLAEGKEKQGELVFSQWVLQANGKTLTPDELPGFEPGKAETSFTLPADWPADEVLSIAPVYADPEQAQDDDFTSTAAAVVGGTALTGLVAWNGYNIFAEVYMKQIWPILPENRGELALSLWHAADEPAAANTTLYTDLEEDDTEGQTADRWAVENELMKPADKDDPDVFRPYRPVTPGQVYRAWKKLQKMKEQQQS